MLIPGRLLFVLAAVTFFASRSSPAMARILVVPPSYPTIQAAVDAAQDGDTVQVLPGTYPESVTWTAKGIRLLGADPEITIVDPSLGPGGRCFTIVDVPRHAVASGFKCQHGSVSPDSGGGMLVQNGSLTVRDFVFADNRAVVSPGDGGGGVRVQGGSPVFRDVRFLRNSVDSITGRAASGGGIYITGASVTMQGCLFEDNQAAPGAGLAVNGELVLFDCTFRRNTVSDRSQGGGAIAIAGGRMTATRCTFDGNLVSSGGVGRAGAVAGGAASGTFIACSFRGNSAGGRSGAGGAIDGFDELTVLRSDFTGNSAEGDAASGGAIDTAAKLTVAQSSFSGNQAEVRGEGGAIRADGPTAIVNSVFRDNIARTGPVGGGGGAVALRGDATIVNSLFSGNQATLQGHLVPSAEGGGLWVTGGGNARVLDSIFTHNVAVESGAVAVDAGASATIINSILFGDIPREIDNAGTLLVSHSIVQGGARGPGNVDADPLFVDPQNGDLHLQHSDLAL